MSDAVSQGQNAVVIDQRDNVAVATYQLEAGAEARYPMPDGTLASVTVTDDIPLFHKIALVDIPKGEKIVKYGEFIGVATTDIKRGQHVHTHNCGGSDPSSGLGSNPLIGEVSDWLVNHGATSVLCETPELFGAEHILARRAKDKQVSDDILKIVYDYEKYVQMFGAEMREGNPSPGNMAGGLTTLEEKSLGCVHKGGHSPLNAVYPYAAQLNPHEGLVVMDTPGNDPSSVGGIIAGGCQLVVFSTGLGTPTGNAIAPVYRLTANKRTYEAMRDNTDLDASPTIYGPESMEEMRDRMLDDIIAVCNGRKVCAEALGYTETALPHICNYM